MLKVGLRPGSLDDEIETRGILTLPAGVIVANVKRRRMGSSDLGEAAGKPQDKTRWESRWRAVDVGKRQQVRLTGLGPINWLSR